MHPLNNSDATRLTGAEVAARLIQELDRDEDVREPAQLFGLPLMNATVETAVDEIIDRAATGTRSTVNFVNAHCINIAARDAHYARILKRSDLLLPDGSGIALAARLAGQSLGDNLNGTDLFPELCKSAADHGLPIFLLGGRPGVAKAAAEEMTARYPTLQIAGCEHGYHGEAAMPDILDGINLSRPALLFVGMGVPIQEKWIAQYREALNAPVVCGVGGLFDYYSGRIPRAPLAMREAGCEWIWRLGREPRRLASRYLIGNPVFIARALGHALAARGIGEQLRERISAGSKRSLDFVLSLSLIVSILPLLVLIGLLIKSEDGGPILFRQTRIGHKGKPFSMLKFRSMAVDAEARRAALLDQSERDSVCFKMKRDPRITRTGRWLRRFSLDELPQIFNVLKSDMALVGPRPALPSEVIGYEKKSWQRLRGKPGITCTWQVSGRAEIPFEQQVRLDIDYLQSRTLFRDVLLLAKTVPAVITGRGAY